MYDSTVSHGRMQQPDPMIRISKQHSSLCPGQQSYNDTCAMRCQEFVLELFNPGMDFDEDALVEEARQHGWWPLCGVCI